MANSTLLSTIISRMNRFTTASPIDDAFKVRDLDEGLRAIRRLSKFPWTLKKSSLKIFDGVKEYPVAADHDDLAYLDSHDGVDSFFAARARYRYTSLQQFYEDPTNRNEIAEIWDQGTRYLGVNYKNIKDASVTLDSGETVSEWTASGDASSPVLDSVNFDQGSGSIRFTITNSSGVATMVGTLPTTIVDANYQRKYYFVRVMFSSVPTSVALQFRVNGSNYLSSTVTTQFSGQAFKANQWMWLAFDLNAATITGAITASSVFASQAIVLNGAASGSYWIDASYLKGWELQDYWYYSIYNVALSGSSVANQEYFYNSSDVYSSDSALVGESEWVDVIMYDALLTELADSKDGSAMLGQVQEKRKEAWASLLKKYPESTPIIITNRYYFNDDFNTPDYNGVGHV